MSGASLFFKPMLRDVGLWNKGILLALSKEELKGMAQLLNISKSGKKEALVLRLLAIKDLRVKLSKVQAPEELVEAYSSKDLKAMCGMAKIWKRNNKCSAAAGLLNWRNRCRQAGQKLINEIRKTKQEAR